MIAALTGAVPTSFSDCPRVTIDTPDEAVAFWRAFSNDPRPVRIVSASIHSVDIIHDHGQNMNDDGQITIHDTRIGGGGTPYMLTSAAYTPKVFNMLAAKHPLPDVASAINLRPVFSIGLNGTGERDLAHHYHSITAMRLLQGRKIWALRSPTDPECDRAIGTCTDPFDVRAALSSSRPLDL